MGTQDLSKMSLAELEKILADKKEAERVDREAKRTEYETERESLINELGAEALNAQTVLTELKKQSFERLLAFRDKLIEYGDIRNGRYNKGNFEIKNGRFKIEFKTQIRKAFDERAELAEAKLRTFLNGYLKKKAHKDVIDIITSLLERNRSNEYDINLINRLYSMKDRFNDVNWSEALDLFQESYAEQSTAQYVRFYEKDINNAWQPLDLNIANAKIY